MSAANWAAVVGIAAAVVCLAALCVARDYWRGQNENARTRLREAYRERNALRRLVAQYQARDAQHRVQWSPPLAELDEAYTPEERQQHYALFDRIAFAEIVAPTAEEGEKWTS